MRAIYPNLIWRIKTDEKIIYLSFDDGPHPTATTFVLDQLHKYNSKASFFCIGKNVLAYPEIYQRILTDGHSVGNHTYHHVNGWKVTNEVYFDEIEKTSALVKSNLFRPPYGRMKRAQINKLRTANHKLQIIMWDVLSGDFDTKISPYQCLQNVLKNSIPGSIIVFHDSSKAMDRMQYALPKVLEYFTKEGYLLKNIEQP